MPVSDFFCKTNGKKKRKKRKKTQRKEGKKEEDLQSGVVQKAWRRFLRCYSTFFPSRHMFLKLALPHLHFYIDTHCVYYFWRLMW